MNVFICAISFPLGVVSFTGVLICFGLIKIYRLSLFDAG